VNVRRGLVSLVIGLVVACANLESALAAPSKACLAAARRIGDTMVLPAWCTVDLENEDRKARLRRLSEGQVRPPQFFEYIVPRASLVETLPGFPTDVPVLRVVFDESVLFDFDRAEIRPDADDVIDIIARSLRSEPPDVALFIAGHTDSVGGDDYNIDLSRRRADAVAHALLDRGIGMSSVFRVAFGKTMPIASNDTDTGRAENRRVEFLFAAKPAAAAAWLAEQASTTCYEGDRQVLDRCRKAITVAEEIQRDTPVLTPMATQATLGNAKSGRIELNADRKASVDLGAKGVKLTARPARRFAIDLGRKAVSIDLPNR
jgi:outer membrane protein OmpA-like peptidoglycan-associated protein